MNRANTKASHLMKATFYKVLPLKKINGYEK